MNANLLQKLWDDELGVIISAELILVSTIMVLGLITGMTCLQEAIVGEFRDLAGAFTSLNQSYYFHGMGGCFSRCGRSSQTFGSSFVDTRVMAFPCDADIVPAAARPMSYAAPSCPTGSCPIAPGVPTGVVPCDPCQNLPLEQQPGTYVPHEIDPAGPQPIPQDATPAIPAPASEAETTSLTQAGPRFPR